MADWFIAHQFLDDGCLGFDTNDLSVIPPKDFYYADPIVIKKNELFYVFFECYDKIKKIGKIQYYFINKNRIISPIKDISIPINLHTSFPFIFESEGHTYMIPETCHLNKINLYECIDFPEKWVFVKTLIDNIHAADNVVFFKDGIWYLFTIVYANKKEYFCIFYSDNILGQWNKHKLVNTNYLTPEKNNNITRMAGRIIEFDNKLIRPTQYSRKGIYGEKVILYLIDKLTTDEYNETPIDLISNSLFNSVHTFSKCENLITIDAQSETGSHKIYSIDEHMEELAILYKLNQY